jgi:hypothetical protein
MLESDPDFIKTNFIFQKDLNKLYTGDELEAYDIYAT